MKILVDGVQRTRKQQYLVLALLGLPRGKAAWWLERKNKRDSGFEERRMKNECDADPYILLQLDGEVFSLPWLRGYGNVKSLPVAYQEDPTLRQAARDLVAQGRNDSAWKIAA